MENQPEKPKTLEMRVAELEDKMAKLHITEDEMKTYQKVAAALGGGAVPPSAAAPVTQASPQFSYRQPWYYHQPYHQPWYYNPFYYQQCYECIQQQQQSSPISGGFTTLGR